MNLPNIELAALPDLGVMTGTYGSLANYGGHDDSIIILATYIYEVMPPDGQPA